MIGPPLTCKSTLAAVHRNHYEKTIFPAATCQHRDPGLRQTSEIDVLSRFADVLT